jgi:acyl-coenzyme A synthetase/AMP-(fatty) acid ligase
VALPLTYSYAFVNQWVWAHTFGRTIVSTRGFARPNELLAALERAEDALLCLVGTQVDLVVRSFGARPFEGVARVCFAGGRFPEERLDDVRRSFPRAAIFNNYGCAEAMPRLSLRRAEPPRDAAHIGWPLPGVDLTIAEDGALKFQSPYGALGWADEEGWHPVSAETWVPTGDLAARDDDGGFRLLGRAGDVFKRHGEKVSLIELMSTVLGVWNGEAALYRETDSSGEPGCVLALSPSPSSADLRKILLALRERHVRAQWPLRLESISAMPRLASGKIDHLALATLPDRTTHWYQRIGNAA